MYVGELLYLQIFSQLSLPSNLLKCVLPFSCGLKSHMYFGYFDKTRSKDNVRRLGVQISGNFAPGYPELFFERVPGTRIFVMFPKITLKKKRVGTPEAAHVDIPVWTHWIYYAARSNSAE